MLRVECPECGEPVGLREDVKVGERIVCVDCGVDLEVLSLYPLEIDYVLEADWGDNWEADDLLYEDKEWVEESSSRLL
jgi:alpha-aminoadipate carrier protein LysW